MRIPTAVPLVHAVLVVEGDWDTSRDPPTIGLDISYGVVPEGFSYEAVVDYYFDHGELACHTTAKPAANLEALLHAKDAALSLLIELEKLGQSFYYIKIRTVNGLRQADGYICK